MKKALIIVDVQNDFCLGGTLAVPGSNEVVEKVNQIRSKYNFDLVIFTKDYHPLNHVSFASTHNLNPFTSIVLENGNRQELWPNHCVQGTKGSELHPELITLPTDKVILKGTLSNIDSYSGFGTQEDNTGLLQLLKKELVDVVYVCGLAYDFCVGYTAIDSAKNGFLTYIIKDASGSINAQTVQKMNQRFQDHEDKIKIIESNNI